MSYVLRKMEIADMKQVMDIERLSFSSPWSPLTYAYEIEQNKHSHMGVVELPETPPQQEVRLDRFQILLRPFFKPARPLSSIVAYGGMWTRNGEAHISTIASHPTYRGQKLGELMLVGLMSRGLALKCDRVVLEVRVSNYVAQQLYLKYGFVKTGRIQGYYRDNSEDADVMAATTFKTRLRENVQALRQHLEFQDKFTGLHLEKEQT